MDAEKSFSYPFEDQNWPGKLGLGAVISMIPILNFAWTGYLVGIIRNVMKHHPQPLPAWDDLDKKLVDGLILFAAGIVYALPLLIAFFLPLGMTALPGLFSGNTDMQDLGRIMTETGTILFFCFLCIFILYGALLSVMYPAVLVMFAREGTFASCFKLREAFDMIRRNAAAFFTAWGLGLVANIAVGLLIGFVNLVVSWVPCIGWIVGMVLALASSVYSTAVYAHLFGQFARIASEGNQLDSTV